jgi:hypothetical protein
MNTTNLELSRSIAIVDTVYSSVVFSVFLGTFVVLCSLFKWQPVKSHIPLSPILCLFFAMNSIGSILVSWTAERIGKVVQSYTSIGLIALVLLLVLKHLKFVLTLYVTYL